MVMPFLGAVPRAVTGIFASVGARLGWSQERVYREMSAAKLSYRRTTQLADIRAYWGRAIKETAARAVRKGYTPSLAVLQESPFKIKHEYQLGVELRGVHRVTGEEVLKNVYMEYDVRPTVSELEEAAESMWGEEYQERLDFEIVSRTFTGGFYRKH